MLSVWHESLWPVLLCAIRVSGCQRDEVAELNSFVLGARLRSLLTACLFDGRLGEEGLLGCAVCILRSGVPVDERRPRDGCPTLATGQGPGQLPAGEVAGAAMLEHLTGLAVSASRALQVERIDVTLAGERRAVEGGARELAIPGGRKGE
ncbi:MAG TPA: hypothetical protein VJ714_04150 [Anaerolineae bacterium]|nr:hypothetical protein [Anaerolineae bacterium]